MNDFEWNEQLRQLGVQSITVENPRPDCITGDEFGALRIPEGPNYTIELNVDSAGLKRLQEAASNIMRSDEAELKHELNVMNEVKKCKGNNINERIENYFEKVDSKAKESRYKIKHR